MDIKEINSAIMFGNLTNTELTSITDAVQYAREQLRKTKIRTFRAGDAVKFYSAKRGLSVTGTVTKVAIKYVTVKDGVMLWKVPANMLEAA